MVFPALHNTGILPKSVCINTGRLEVAVDDDSTVTKNKEAKVRVISKRNCISICLVTIVFAVLLLTGKFYSILAELVHNILNMFR